MIDNTCCNLLWTKNEWNQVTKSYACSPSIVIRLRSTGPFWFSANLRLCFLWPGQVFYTVWVREKSNLERNWLDIPVKVKNFSITSFGQVRVSNSSLSIDCVHYSMHATLLTSRKLRPPSLLCICICICKRICICICICICISISIWPCALFNARLACDPPRTFVC